MRAVIQRVKRASVTVDSQILSKIDRGLVVLIGICPEDTLEDCERLSAKVANLRLWPTDDGVQWRQSVRDVSGQILCVSQFTLYGRVHKGTKPDFHAAAKGEQATALYDEVRKLLAKHMPNGESDIFDGKFGAMMDVELVNDGPVTIQYDTRAK